MNSVKAAIELQSQFSNANAGLPEDSRILLRIGINLGDVVGEGGDIYGDGVNIAARLETLAEPGGICVSAKIYAETSGKVAAVFEDLGEQPLKNIARPVPAFGLSRVPRRSRHLRTQERNAAVGRHCLSSFSLLPTSAAMPSKVTSPTASPKTLRPISRGSPTVS